MKREEFRTLVPTGALHIPDPDDGFRKLPAEGKRVRMSTYWVQLLADGSVTDATEQPKPATKASKADS